MFGLLIVCHKCYGDFVYTDGWQVSQHHLVGGALKWPFPTLLCVTVNNIFLNEIFLQNLSEHWIFRSIINLDLQWAYGHSCLFALSQRLSLRRWGVWGVNAWEIVDNVEIITRFLQVLANKIKRDLTELDLTGSVNAGRKIPAKNSFPAVSHRELPGVDLYLGEGR